MLDKIGSADNAEKWLKERARRARRFAGFGHRVYRTYDPRAKLLREMAKDAAPRVGTARQRHGKSSRSRYFMNHTRATNATNVDFWRRWC